MNKIIPVKTTIDKFFREYLEIINPLVKLTNREKDVLAELLLLNYKYKHLESDIRSKIIFDYDSRMLVASKLNMSEASLNNNISYLRKRGIISNWEISPIFVVYPDENYNVVFNFSLYGLEAVRDSKEVSAEV